MRFLMKFGGTSVADGKCIARVVEILDHYHSTGNELAVVVSAVHGVTDQLVSAAEDAVWADDGANLDQLVLSLRTRHSKTLAAVAPDHHDEVMQEIDARLSNLKNILSAVHNLRELTPRSRDYIISFGERLSAPVVSAALRQHGIPSVALDGCEAGILTNSDYGNAKALPESGTRIRSRVVPLLTDQVPVIMGFMGCTENGSVTTFGRSGSDYSASIVGAGIDADEIWIWTDVDGVMTSDPRMITDARVIPMISYLEAMELSYFGAKVLHPRSIEPAMQKEITLRVKNTFNPSHPGTCVIRREHREKRVVKAISYIEKVALININGSQMIGRPGVARAIFSALADNHVNVMMISQGSSEANISLIIDENHLDRAILALSEVVKAGIVREVTTNRDVIAVAVVGAGMAGEAGTGGRIFSALGEAGVNVMMISQGSSEVNISFVVRGEQGPCALRALHDEFCLSEECNE